MLNSFFSSEFLFQINRVQLASVDKIFALVGATAFVVFFILRLSARFALNPIDKKYRNNLSSPFLFLAILEIFWYLARVQLVKFFGSHFVASVVILIFFVWLIWRGIQMFKYYNKDIFIWEKEQVKQKYLTKK